MIKMSVLLRIATLAAIAAAGYWYWSGPYQEKTNPSYQSLIEQNDQRMAECMRGAAYQLGATGSGTNSDGAREQCAQKYNLYELDGHWHSYDMTRPE